MARDAALTADLRPSDRAHHATRHPPPLALRPQASASALRPQPRCELASSFAAYSTMYLLILTSPATGVTPPLSSVRT